MRHLWMPSLWSCKCSAFRIWGLINSTQTLQLPRQAQEIVILGETARRTSAGHVLGTALSSVLDRAATPAGERAPSKPQIATEAVLTLWNIVVSIAL